MIHVFKKGGERGTPPNDYSIECINEDESAGYLADGWFLSLDEALSVPADESDYYDSGHDSDHDDGDEFYGVEQVEQVEQENVADTNGDGKLSIKEARAYLESVGVTYEEGLHWKKVVALAEQHMKGE